MQASFIFINSLYDKLENFIINAKSNYFDSPGPYFDNIVHVNFINDVLRML